MTQNETGKQPFFARFLESQKRVNAGEQNLIDPWPVPVPTAPLKDIEHTLKYPSDGDEI